MPSRTIEIDYVSRVEGEGALYVRLKGKEATEVRLDIFEPPRLFEALLVGREHTEAPDVTSRICGICPIAYQLSSAQAMEDALGIDVGAPVRELRRLIFCGEWIESHALHVFFLHAPDFLGHADGLTAASEHPEEMRRGLRIKKLGNAIIAVLGGRSIHPVNIRIGGFHRMPNEEELRPLLPELRWAREAMEASLRWLAGFSFPNYERDYELVALRHPEQYPICEGRIASSSGLDIAVQSYDANFYEEQVPGSNALRSSMRGRGAYLCGPLARFNLSFDRLDAEVQQVARAIGLQVPCRNPFKSLLVRGIEILESIVEATRLIEAYRRPARAFVESCPRPATGCGCTEAPRGLLYHRYSLDEAGIIRQATIVPPTAQSLRTIEDDVQAFGPVLAGMGAQPARLLAQRVVRNHDPCISCSTHGIRIDFDRW